VRARVGAPAPERARSLSRGTRPGRAAADFARGHPRHVLLAGVVVGLLCAGAPAGAWGLAAAVVLLSLAVEARGGRALALALATAGAILAGGLGGAARLAALDRSALGPLLGRAVSVRGTLLERPRPVRGRSGPGTGRDQATALVRLTAGAGRGERVAVRAAGWPAARVGAELAATGALRALGPHDGWQRRRGAHARLFADQVRATGRTRAGLAGVVDRLRARAERAVSAGLDPRRAALARGMVLGEDEALSDDAREEFRVSGLAHLVR
jgi:competence protein ComEC